MDCPNEEQDLRAFEDGCADRESYQKVAIPEEELQIFEDFVIVLLLQHDFATEEEYDKALRAVRKEFKVQPSKPHIVRAYYRLRKSGRIDGNLAFERLASKKAVQLNSGVVVITVVATLSKLDPVNQFLDQARVLAEQGHPLHKVEITILGGAWSWYSPDYREEFCRDLFYAANTFDKDFSKPQERGNEAATRQTRHSLLEEQCLNEKSSVEIVGLTLEMRPDFVNIDVLRQIRQYGCVHVLIGMQHTDDEVLRYTSRAHRRQDVVNAVRLLKTCGFQVNLHIMPDLPGSSPDKDQAMLGEVLQNEDLQADRWKITPCEVTPFSVIEQWYREGSYMPYTEDPSKLFKLLTEVQGEVHPWIMADDIRCREVQDCPEAVEKLHVRVRQYRSSQGTEYFLSVEGGSRGNAASKDGKKQKPSKAEKRQRKAQRKRREGEAVACQGGGDAEADAAAGPAKTADASEAAGADNAELYALLRLRFNDNADAAGEAFPELRNCALIRDLHINRVLDAWVGQMLVAAAEQLAASRSWPRIAVIAGVGVRTYYRALGYEQRGHGQYLIKDLRSSETTPLDSRSLELPLPEAAAKLQEMKKRDSRHAQCRAALAITLSLAAAAVSGFALQRHWCRKLR
mmetsp:Transcript_158800/g.281552  ORF Transcript_158800/g.281552 Transcript_158800/m.281552 type:complete len:627 (-) Transcript_158800:95-1975(-)